VKGFGKITKPNEVTVDLSAGGQQVLSAKNIVIATGSEPTSIPNVKVRVQFTTCQAILTKHSL
jgi:dihydrolipoamide dehydrogenase